MVNLDEAILKLDTALIWLGVEPDHRYFWHREEDAVLRRFWQRIPRHELSRRVNEVLRRLTGDPAAERTITALCGRAAQLALPPYRGEPGELILSEAAKESAVAYETASKAFRAGELSGSKRGKCVYVTPQAWANWLVGYRERLFVQGEVLNALEGESLLSKQEAMRLTCLSETHLTRYLQSGVIRAWMLPSVRPGRGEWLVSRDSAEAFVMARAEGRLKEVLDSRRDYVTLRRGITTQIRNLRRAGRIEKRDPLTEPKSRYHPGCFTVRQVSSHTGLSMTVVYEAVESGRLKAESRVFHGRPRYAVRPAEARRFAAEVASIPDESARRDTLLLRQIAAAGLLTVRDLCRRWQRAEHTVLIRVKRYGIPNRKWGRYIVFEPAVIEKFEAEKGLTNAATI